MAVLVRFGGMGFYTGFALGTGFAIRARVALVVRASAARGASLGIFPSAKENRHVFA